MPTAIHARFDPEKGFVWVELDNSCVFGFPATHVEDLRNASTDLLAKVEILPRGVGLHWDALDVDLSLDGLLMGVFGSRRWMAALGRLGGKAKSAAKARAARENGRKGGRPRKDTPNPVGEANAEGRDPGPPEFVLPEADADPNVFSTGIEGTIGSRRWSSRTPGARTPSGSNTPPALTPAA